MSIYRASKLTEFSLGAMISASWIWAGVAGPNVRNSGEAFWCIWLALTALFSWVFLRRVAYKLTLSGAEFTWKAPLQSRTVPVTEVKAITECHWNMTKSGWSTSAYVRFEPRGRIVVFVHRGFKEFAEDLEKAAPGLPVPRNWEDFMKLMPKWPGHKTGYEHVGDGMPTAGRSRY